MAKKLWSAKDVTVMSDSESKAAYKKILSGAIAYRRASVSKVKGNQL